MENLSRVYEREKSKSTSLDHHTFLSVSVFARISVKIS